MLNTLLKTMKDEKMGVKDEKMRAKDEKMRAKDEFVFCFLVFVYTDAYIATQIAKNNARYVDMEKEKNITVIRKSNDLIEAKYKLSVNEQRLVSTLLTTIRPDDEDFKDYIVQVDDLAKMFGIENGKDLYARTHESAKSLLRMGIEISEGERKRYATWFSYVEYIEGRGEILLRFDKSLKPYLLQLKERYTGYLSNYAFELSKSKYSIRFYELLKMRQNQGGGGEFWIKYNLVELRRKFNIEDSEYTRFNDFSRFVINPALQEINEITDLSIINCEYLKSGRKITSIKITAKPKIHVLDQPLQVNTEKEITEAVASLTSIGIVEETAIKWVRKFGKSRVLRNVAYTLAMQKQGHVKSIIAYLATCLDADAGKGWEESVREQDEIEKAKIEDIQRTEEKELEIKEKSKQETRNALEKFWTLSESTQEAMRDMFSSGLNSTLRSIWKNAKVRPEEKPMFTSQFINLLRENNVI